MKRLALAVTMAVAGTGLAPAAAHAAPADTFVEFNDVEYELHTDETRFSGEIFSDRRKCLLDRKVVVYRKRSGKDEKMGKTEANEDKPNKFGWAVSSPGEAKAGTYYAKAPATDGCNADKSKPYEYAGAPPIRAATAR